MCINWSITKLLSHLIIYGTDVLTAANRANVNVSSDRHLWHDFVRGYNLYLDKETKVFVDFETTEDRLTFLIHIPIHAGCGNKPATEKTTVITTEKSAKVTAAEIAMKLGVSSRAVEKRIKLCAKMVSFAA